MTRKFIYLVAAAALIQPVAVFAQGKGQSLASLGLKCSDFQKNEDGTWSPVHAITLPAGGARISLGRKDILGPTTSIMGNPLGTTINTECSAH